VRISFLFLIKGRDIRSNSRLTLPLLMISSYFRIQQTEPQNHPETIEWTRILYTSVLSSCLLCFLAPSGGDDF
jgi:hypothetical protein